MPLLLPLVDTEVKDVFESMWAKITSGFAPGKMEGPKWFA